MGKGGTRIARRYVISGRVQGVGYRFFAEHWAHRLGIRGYVKNLWDGNVEVYAIGEEALLGEFKRRLADGPRSAHVASIEESDDVVNNRYAGFLVESGW